MSPDLDHAITPAFHSRLSTNWLLHRADRQTKWTSASSGGTKQATANESGNRVPWWWPTKRVVVDDNFLLHTRYKVGWPPSAPACHRAGTSLILCLESNWYTLWQSFFQTAFHGSLYALILIDALTNNHFFQFMEKRSQRVGGGLLFRLQLNRSHHHTQ